MMGRQQEPADAFLSTHPAAGASRMDKPIYLVLPVFARAKASIRTSCRHTVRSRCRILICAAPLPMRDGVAPSYLYCRRATGPT
jgi:hypothetical protein